MIYFVVAQREEDGKWEVFGPYEQIDKADNKIARLDDNSDYSQIELARVLTDEDDPDRTEWLDRDKHEPTKEEIIVYPDHWPKRHYNSCSKPCDVIDGPCVCGAWHCEDETWIKSYVSRYGLEKNDS